MRARTVSLREYPASVQSMSDPPNILFVLTDQQRGDAVGVDPDSERDANDDPILHTPNINELANDGALFRRAYTPVPSSMPARRCLITGQTPATNGAPGWVSGPWNFRHTLPGTLRDHGYQTHVIGKYDAQPPRKHCGFEGVELQYALGTTDADVVEYDEYLRETVGTSEWTAAGVDVNSWDARPFHLAERHHPTTWTTDRAIAFIERQDPTRPFFLQLAYYFPHRPFTPSEPYWNQYLHRDLEQPARGAWSEALYGNALPKAAPTKAWRYDLSEREHHRAKVGYYGSITQIDQQLNRVLELLRQRGQLENTLIIFSSDHGEMLGDHYLGRKTYPFEGSARVPLIVRYPDGSPHPRGMVIDQPVGLEDIMPTVLEQAQIDIPETVDGTSLLRVIDGDATDPTYYHGEHSPIYDEENAWQFLVNERFKYVWNPVTGQELFFDLRSDPRETQDLSKDEAHKEDVTRFRVALIDHLRERDEQFTDGSSLLACKRESPIPHPVRE